MLRRTASRAFVLGDEDKAPPSAALRQGARHAALERFFAAFHDVLASGIDAIEEAPEGATAAPAFSLGRPRSLPGGVEFVLEGPAAAFRFVNAQDGWIRVERRAAPGAGTAGVFCAALSVGLEHGEYRPLHKVVPAPGAGQWRTPFSFSSVRALAREYLQAVGAPLVT